MRQKTVALTSAFVALLILLVIHCLPLIALASPRIYTDKKTYLPGEAIQVYYSGAPGASGDWICIVPSSTPDNDAGPNWQHMPYATPQGVLTFVASNPGEYEARAYYGYRTIGYVVAVRSSFRVASQASEPPRRTYRERAEESPVVSAPDPKLKEAQYALMERGYDPGTADGLSGRLTRSAIRAFQKDNRLKQTGELNRETLVALGLISGGAKEENADDLGAKPVEPRIDRIAPPPARRDDRLVPESGKGAGLLDPKDTRALPEPPVEPKAASPVPMEPSISDKGQITAATTLAAGASVMADSLGDVPRGATVDILGTQDNFLKVRYNGREGYINTNFIQRQ